MTTIAVIGSEEPAADHRQIDLEFHEARADVVEAVALVRFAHERFDQRDPGDRERLLRDRFDLVALFARLLADVVHAPTDRREREDHERNDHDRDERKPPIQDEDRHEGRHDGHDVRDDRDQRSGDDVVDVVDVVADAVHDFAGLRAGEEGDRHPVQVRDEAGADVAHDPFADDRVEIALQNADSCRDDGRSRA